MYNQESSLGELRTPEASGEKSLICGNYEFAHSVHSYWHSIILCYCSSASLQEIEIVYFAC